METTEVLHFAATLAVCGGFVEPVEKGQTVQILPQSSVVPPSSDCSPAMEFGLGANPRKDQSIRRSTNAHKDPDLQHGSIVAVNQTTRTACVLLQSHRIEGELQPEFIVEVGLDRVSVLPKVFFFRFQNR